MDARDTGAVARLADLLVQGFATGIPIAELPPDSRIASPAEAYRAQAILAGRLGPVAGWKVGRKSPAATPIRAPLPAARLHRSGVTLPRDGLWRLEAELAFRLARDLPPTDRAYDRSAVAAAVGEVVAVFEIVDSRFTAWPDLPPQLALADLQSHGALVVGSAAPMPPDPDFAETPVRLAIDGSTMVERRGGNPAGDILDLLAWLANALAAEGKALRAGDLVTTGSCTGLLPLPPGGRAEAEFAGIGRVAVARSA